MKRYRARFRAFPHLFRARLKVEFDLVSDLRFGIAWRDDFHTDFWRDRKTLLAFQLFAQAVRNPDGVTSLHPLGSRNGAFRDDFSFRLQLSKEKSYLKLFSTMVGSGRCAHDDLSKAVSFDAIRETSQKLILKHFLPTRQVEGGLIKSRFTG